MFSFFTTEKNSIDSEKEIFTSQNMPEPVRLFNINFPNGPICPVAHTCLPKPIPKAVAWSLHASGDFLLKEMKTSLCWWEHEEILKKHRLIAPPEADMATSLERKSVLMRLDNTVAVTCIQRQGHKGSVHCWQKFI